jgi:tripartite-type tricarboxylate transporter receptor subunit TctC
MDGMRGESLRDFVSDRTHARAAAAHGAGSARGRDRPAVRAARPIALVACVALFAAIRGPAIAATPPTEFPERPIRFLVPFPPGGGTDFLAREVANKLWSTFGWNVVIENRPGAGGTIGLEAAARATPDGYTIVMGQTSNLAIMPALRPNASFDPRRELMPVTLVASAPLVLVVRPDRPWKTFADLTAHVKAKGADLTFASAGNGTVGHLAGELVRLRTRLPMIHVPYKGAAPAITDLLGGQVDLYFSTLPAAVTQVKAGKLRALAITTPTRSDALPDVPGMAELGHPQIEATSWYGVLAPAGTPPAAHGRLAAAIAAVLRTPETARRIAQEGGDVIGGVPELFAAFLRTEQAKWAQIVRQSGAKID